MRRALVIGITRLGDLIQTEPMLRALKSSGQADHVTVLVERTFKDIADELVGANEILAVDFADILGTLMSGCRLPYEAYRSLDKTLSNGKYDCVINVSHTRPSMVLAALVTDDAMGVTLDREGHQVVNNRWLQYFFATNLARPWCCFNLVDTYVNAVAPDTSADARKPKLRRVASTSSVAKSTNRLSHVLLHAGASQSDKQWPEELFAKLAEELLENGARVSLIGASKPKSESSFPKHPRLTDLCGKTSVQELIDLCCEASLMISADSGPVHVAAASNLPLVVIEGGSAHAFETAPYCNDALILQPHLPHLLERKPGKGVTSAPASGFDVATVLRAAIGQIEPSLLGDKSIYRTRLSESAHGIELVPISGSHTDYEAWQFALREFWWWALGPNACEAIHDCDFQLGNLFQQCAQQADRVAHNQLSLTALEARANALAAAERRLQDYLLSIPALHHVAQFLQIARASVRGEISDQATELAELYTKLTAASPALQPVIENFNFTISRSTKRLEGVA